MPGSVGITAGGQTIVRPGVYPVIDASALEPRRLNTLGTVGFIGAADGGIPGQVYEFRSFAEALAVVRGGDALSYLARIFRPSATLPGAGLVRFTRLGAPTQSTGALAGLTFTSVDYGRHTTGISVQIAVGVSTPWAVTVRKRLDNVSETFNVGLGISVQSTATSPKIVFDHAAKQMKVYTGGTPTIIATMDYPNDSVTLANAVNFINGLSGWTAKVDGDPSMPVRYMDNPVLGSAPAILTTYTALPASQGQLIWLLTNDAYVTAALTTGTTFGALSTVAETYLSGGTGTALDTFVSNDWSAALTTMSTQDVQFLFVASSDPTVLALAYQHCLDMRTVKQKRYRILVAGGPVGETAAQAEAIPPTIPGPAVYVWNGTYSSNPLTGLTENLGGLGSAAQLCGLSAGSYVSEPATGKFLLGSKLENPAATDSDITDLLLAGVTPIVQDVVTGSPRVEQAITTYQGGANVAFRKLQGLRIQDEIARGFAALLSDFVGSPLDLTTAFLIKGAAAKFLDSVIRTAQNPGGYLTPGRVNSQDVPAWENLTVTGDGLDLWDISVEVHPVGESDYIRVSVQLTPAPIAI